MCAIRILNKKGILILSPYKWPTSLVTNPASDTSSGSSSSSTGGSAGSASSTFSGSGTSSPSERLVSQRFYNILIPLKFIPDYGMFYGRYKGGPQRANLAKTYLPMRQGQLAIHFFMVGVG